jgi:NADH:ubiquinone oxidoreductase subunit D
MATYTQIKNYVKEHYGFKPKECWIAHVKEMSGIKIKPAWNRQGIERKEPCPPKKVEVIREALMYFRMIE